MRSFLTSAGIRIKDKCSIKERIEFAIKCMMHEPVAHACFVNVTRFRVAYLEVVITAVTVTTVYKVAVQI